MIYVDWDLGGRRKNFRVGIYLDKKLVRVGFSGNKQLFLGLNTQTYT